MTVVLAATVAFTGCSGSNEAVDRPALPTAGATPRSVAPSPKTGCYAPIPGRRTAYAPVSCDDPAAEARELVRVNSSLSKDGKYLAEALTSGPIALKSVVEIPCSEAADHKPAYRVFELDASARCPEGRTDLSFVIGPLGNLSSETSKTGCAKKL